MGFNDLQRIPTLSGGRFALFFPRVALLFLLVFCFISGSFTGPGDAAESAWQTVVGEGESGSSPSGAVPFTTTPVPVPAPQPGGGIAIQPSLAKEAFSLQSRGGVSVRSVVPGAELRAGERAIIELKLEGSLGYVGGVDIEIDGKGPYPAKDEEITGHYFCYWDLPKTPGKKVNIVSRVQSLTGDKVLASYSRLITIQPVLAKGKYFEWHGVIPVVPGALLQAGERATIELKVQGSVAHIGSIEIEIDGDSHGFAKKISRGHYLLYWKIPVNSAGPVEIVWITHPPTGDDIATYTNTFTIQPAEMPFLVNWKKCPERIRLDEVKKAIVEVLGGTAPYTYSWKISINNNTLRSSKISHYKKSCDYEIGPFDDPKMIGKDIEVEVEIRDLEGESRTLKDLIYVPQSEFRAYFETSPGKLEVGESGYWAIRCYHDDIDQIRVGVNCGDNTPNPAVAYREKRRHILLDFCHTYTNVGTYTIDVIIMDVDGATIKLKKEVKIIPRILTIVEFIGPKEPKVNRWSTFKVKIKPHSESKPPYKYTFYFGDNSTGYESGEFVEVEKAHYYREANIYPVRVRVEDSCGSFGESNIQVTVTE